MFPDVWFAPRFYAPRYWARSAAPETRLILTIARANDDTASAAPHRDTITLSAGKEALTLTVDEDEPIILTITADPDPTGGIA